MYETRDADTVSTTVARFLEEKRWKYERLEYADGNRFVFSPLLDEIGVQFNYAVAADRNGCTVSAIFPVRARGEAAAVMAEFVRRANERIRFGALHAETDGEQKATVSFRCAVNGCSSEQLFRAVRKAGAVLERFSGGIAGIIFGFTVEDALASCEPTAAARPGRSAETRADEAGLLRAVPA